MSYSSRLLPVVAWIAVGILLILGILTGGAFRMFWWEKPTLGDPMVTQVSWANQAEKPPLTTEQVASLVTSRLPNEEPEFLEARKRMLIHHLHGRDITDSAVLRAMGRVPRQLFVSEPLRELAYADHPLPIGHEQTISQPYIVALMTQLAQPSPESRALDIGTGSGYHAAVLAEICKEVYSIEIIKPLAEEAEKRLQSLGYTNITVRHGDGYRGWPEKAPFHVIIVAAAPDHVPQPLVDQLAPGGRLVLPVGRFYQQLLVVEKQLDGTVRRIPSVPVSFVPMTGEAERQ